MKSLLMFGSAFVAAVAFAQAPLGTVGNVQGLVTFSEGANGGTVASGSAIRNGMRFVTTSRASVTLQLNNGCTVTLRPDHAVTVLERMTCQELIAAVQPVGGQVFSGAGAGGSAGMGAFAIGGLALAGFAVHRGLDKNPSLSGQ